MQSITFIGNGNMALSIAKGLKDNYKIEIVGRSLEKLQSFEKELGTEVEKNLIDGYDMSQKTIILCVKPVNIDEISQKLQGEAKVIFSVLAGTQISKISKKLKPNAVVRVMPNLAASVNKSMTTLTGDEKFKTQALELFDTIGTTLWLSSEKELDIATALAGSGPAYLALIAEALSDGAVKQGIKREDALKTMRGLFDGFAGLIQNTHPALLKDAVMSPGGTTAAGYSALESAKVRSACIDAVQQAYKKATKLK
jgi:pyrroline-5-carboxylate reductase